MILSYFLMGWDTLNPPPKTKKSLTNSFYVGNLFMTFFENNVFTKNGNLIPYKETQFITSWGKSPKG